MRRDTVRKAECKTNVTTIYDILMSRQFATIYDIFCPVAFPSFFGFHREFLLVSLGERFGVGLRWVEGGGFPVKNKGQGEWGGELGGGRAGKGTGKSMRKLCRNYP